jgi:hypothetical protein
MSYLLKKGGGKIRQIPLTDTHTIGCMPEMSDIWLASQKRLAEGAV